MKTKEQSEKEMQCACGGKCNGTCREEHLYRSRQYPKPSVCPAAYTKRPRQP